jgi:dolichol-phosphate mannosyltransferase
MTNEKIAFFLRMIKFGIVGTSGIFVNQCVLVLCVKIFNIDYKIGSLMAIETAIITNFLLNYNLTFGDRKRKDVKSKAAAFLKFNATSFATAFLLNWGTLVFLTEVAHIKYWISNLAGIFVAAAVNFCVSNFWVFKKN